MVLKKQSNVGTSVFGAEYVAMKQEIYVTKGINTNWGWQESKYLCPHVYMVIICQSSKYHKASINFQEKAQLYLWSCDQGNSNNKWVIDITNHGQEECNRTYDKNSPLS